MHRWILSLIAVALVASGALYALSPTIAQDDDDQRIDDLEERVTALEATVAAMTEIEGSTPVAEAVDETYTINGMLYVVGLDRQAIVRNNAADGCVIASSSGYSDVRAGAQITVTDGGGNLLATGRLNTSFNTSDSDQCRFRFTIEDVPASDFYTIEMGRRGGLSYTFAEMDAIEWDVQLVLGN